MNDDQSIYILSRYAEFLYEEKLNPLNSHYVERTKDSFVKDLHTIHDVLYWCTKLPLSVFADLNSFNLIIPSNIIICIGETFLTFHRQTD